MEASEDRDQAGLALHCTQPQPQAQQSQLELSESFPDKRGIAAPWKQKVAAPSSQEPQGTTCPHVRGRQPES